MQQLVRSWMYAGLFGSIPPRPADIQLDVQHIPVVSYIQGRIYARAKGARAQGGKFPGAAY
jgi:hypothetical protein